MASIVKLGGVALALIVLIVASSTFDTISVADARIRTPYNHARQLADDYYDEIKQSEDEVKKNKKTKKKRSEDEGRHGGSRRPGIPSGPTTGASRCKKGCCGATIKGMCQCCK